MAYTTWIRMKPDHRNRSIAIADWLIMPTTDAQILKKWPGSVEIEIEAPVIQCCTSVLREM